MNRTNLAGAAWRKSSRSNGQANCVEVAVAAAASREGGAHVIAVRDSKNPAGPKLLFTPAAWHAFTAGVRDREFDFS